METKINRELEKVFKSFDDKYYIDGVLNKSKVIEDLTSYNPDLLKTLLDNKYIKKNYSIEIDNNTILKVNDLRLLLEMNNYWESSYTKYLNKIGLSTNRKYLDEVNDVVLDFPFKDTILKASMSKEDTDKNDLRPDEPFLNEILAKEEIDTLLDKKILKNIKKYDENGEHDIDVFNDEDNLIIKGNNLLALHSLKDKYMNSIKGIFIDPPYYFHKKNKGDSFKYNSDFKLSTWLTFMKNRIEILKDLLSNDGVIAIVVGIDGYSHLKILMDEIFDVSTEPKRYIGTITWRKTDNQSNIGDFANVIDYILLYKKETKTKLNNLPLTDKAKKEYSYTDLNGDKYRRSNLLDHTRGRYNYEVVTPDGGKIFGPWMIDKEEYNDLLIKDKIHWPSKGKQIPYGKIYLKETLEKGQITSDFWDSSYGTNQRSADEIKKLFGDRVFEFSKPEKLVQNILSLISSENDIILDCFMGSATTQAVAMKMKRRFIGIEQMDYINSISVPRLQKVINGEQGGISEELNWQGGDSFIYAELMEKNIDFIKEIYDVEKEIELKEILNRLVENAEIDYKVDIIELQKTINELSLENQKKALIKIIEKNQLYYNYSEIDDEKVRGLISNSDYDFNKSFYEGDKNE